MIDPCLRENAFGGRRFIATRFWGSFRIDSLGAPEFSLEPNRNLLERRSPDFNPSERNRETAADAKRTRRWMAGSGRQTAHISARARIVPARRPQAPDRHTRPKDILVIPNDFPFPPGVLPRRISPAGALRANPIRQEPAAMTRSQLDQSLTRVARAGFYTIMSLGCVVAFALCSSPSTYAPLLKRPDGSVVFDSSGSPIIVQNWKTNLVNDSPAIIAFSASAFFLVLAVRAVVRREPPRVGDTNAEQVVCPTGP